MKLSASKVKAIWVSFQVKKCQVQRPFWTWTAKNVLILIRILPVLSLQFLFTLALHSRWLPGGDAFHNYKHSRVAPGAKSMWWKLQCFIYKTLRIAHESHSLQWLFLFCYQCCACMNPQFGEVRGKHHAGFQKRTWQQRLSICSFAQWRRITCCGHTWPHSQCVCRQLSWVIVIAI